MGDRGGARRLPPPRRARHLGAAGGHALSRARTVRYPAWYDEPWKEAFEARFEGDLRPSVRILDLGPGRRPTVPASARPPGTRYVALDSSSEELAAAPPGSYDEVVVGDAGVRRSELEQEFDLVVSWQVLEHVRSLRATVAAVRSYLVPGGRFVALTSGTFAAHSVVNRVMSHRVAVRLNERLIGRAPDSMFPAYYDRLWYSALVGLFHDWRRAEIVPRYRGASYFSFNPVVFRLYVAYEGWARRAAHRNLATHYLIDAVR